MEGSLFMRSVLMVMGVLSVGMLCDATVLKAETPSSYTCANREFQITCNQQKCESSDGFTPMSVTVSLQRKAIDVCAYSGCWKGRFAGARSDAKLVVLQANRLQPNAPGLAPEDVAMIIDKKSSGAVFSGFGFLVP